MGRGLLRGIGGFRGRGGGSWVAVGDGAGDCTCALYASLL